MVTMLNQVGVNAAAHCLKIVVAISQALGGLAPRRVGMKEDMVIAGWYFDIPTSTPKEQLVNIQPDTILQMQIDVVSGEMVMINVKAYHKNLSDKSRAVDVAILKLNEESGAPSMIGGRPR